MRLTDRHSPKLSERSPWVLFDRYADILGVVLDDKFAHSHLTVYEHRRVPIAEMYAPPDESAGFHLADADDDHETELANEEREFLSVLNAPEEHRLLQVIGDVGVGKSTFIRHLTEAHLSSSPFPRSHVIHLDWKGFTASLEDPMPDIYWRFARDVFTGIESFLSPREIQALDFDLFKNASLFSMTRNELLYLPESDHETARNEGIRRAIRDHPVELAYARLNQLCSEDRNGVILVFDNIDQVDLRVLEHLMQFFIEVQSQTTPLTVIALRDHTESRMVSRFSQYRKSAVTASWRMRLHSPDVKSLLQRRLEHFFPKHDSDLPHSIPAGPFRVKLSRNQTRSVCRNLLMAPVRHPKTLHFLTAWGNYSIRSLFKDLQNVVAFHGLKGFESRLIEGAEVELGVDDCLVALTLGRSILYYADQSPVLNIYGSKESGEPVDCLVTARIVQYLANQPDALRYDHVVGALTRFGYSFASVQDGLKGMIGKDVVWTDAGDPEDVTEETTLRLSYRGRLYHEQLMRRSTYNYMMSFDVHAPDVNHPIVRDYRSEFMAEITRFVDRTATLDTDAFCERVLALADVISIAEDVERRNLASRHLEDEFLGLLGGRSIALVILDGLESFVNKLITTDGRLSRGTEQPRTDTLAKIAEKHRQLDARDLKHVR